MDSTYAVTQPNAALLAAEWYFLLSPLVVISLAERNNDQQMRTRSYVAPRNSCQLKHAPILNYDQPLLKIISEWWVAVTFETFMRPCDGTLPTRPETAR